MRLHGEGCAGRGVAEKADGRQDAGDGSGGSRDERAERARVGAGVVSIASAQAAYGRTREDPFAEVFESELAPLLAADREGILEATTSLAELNRRHPDRFDESQLRTLQRRVRQWRALNGPDKEVFFPQEHPPGREAAYDFTNCDELGVTICGAPFDHLLFELVLSFSGWRWPTVALSESFEALALSEQEALWRLGGVVEVLRSDNLSAATHELPLSGGRALTRRYRGLLDHYGTKSTRIFPRKAHENGVVEQAHRRTKSILAQTLMLRGSRDFPNVEEYQRWVREVIERDHNAPLGEKLGEERGHLQPLPPVAMPAYTVLMVKVRRWSTIRVLNHTYSVLARLIGERVRVLLHHDHLEQRFGQPQRLVTPNEPPAGALPSAAHSGASRTQLPA